MWAQLMLEPYPILLALIVHPVRATGGSLSFRCNVDVHNFGPNAIVDVVIGQKPSFAFKVGHLGHQNDGQP